MVKDESQPATNRDENLSARLKASDEQAIESYLDRLCDQLQMLPPARREEIRREVRGHLELLIARQSSEPDAVQAALAQFGVAQEVGRDWAHQARRDHWRLWWRGLRWQVRTVLFSLLFIGFWGAAMTVEFCRQMQWGHHLTAWIIIGPLLPLIVGFWWGTRVEPTRHGYLLIGLAALIIAAFLPIPGQFAHADMDDAGMMNLSGLVRFTFVVLWLWSACSACGIARIFTRSPEKKHSLI